MKRIGEIFEYNGEWYQCLIGNCCRECDFSSNNITCDIHGALICTCKGRSDETSVVFKKLEKVGELFTVGRELCQHYKVFDIDNVCGDVSWNVHNYKAKTILIELKQNKDMKTVKVSKDDLNFLINKIRYGILPEYTDCDAIIAEITDLFSVEDVILSNSKNIGKNLKPFDLDAAKAGKSVCTRDGRKARIICFDKITRKNYEELKIVALIREKDEENIHVYNNEGKKYHEDSPIDLMMLPEKKEGWVNVYQGLKKSEYVCGDIVSNTKEEAIQYAQNDDTYITTVKISWEE